MLDSYAKSLRIYLSLSILRSKGVLFFGVVHPNALSFFAGPNSLIKSEEGLHLYLQQAKV